MADTLHCPACGFELLEVTAKGQLLGWTCQVCCPVFSTARMLGAFVDWITEYRGKRRAKKRARARQAPRKLLPAKRP